MKPKMRMLRIGGLIRPLGEAETRVGLCRDLGAKSRRAVLTLGRW